MRKLNGKTFFSASDLVAFLQCSHRSSLDLLNLDTPLERAEADEQVELIRDKGFAYEAAYLDTLRMPGSRLVEIPTEGHFDEKLRLTLQAMASGADIIYQAALADGSYQGFADFLRRVDSPSNLGAWSYEVADTKLAHHAKPKFVIQLAFYSELLGKAQGVMPARMHLVLGNRIEQSFRVADFAHYYQRLTQRFEAFIATRPTTVPEQCEACTYCDWRDRCRDQWQREDHLNRVANISKVQIKRLNQNGVLTLAQLGRLDPEASVAKMQPETLNRLRAQAALQLRKFETGKDQLEMLPRFPGGGFNRLPQPNPGDLFFDMEGDPLHEGGLEYLFGLYSMENGAGVFRDFWAHDRREEKATFASFIDLVIEHLARNPEAHIYHYAHYEPTALKRLMSLHGTREAQVDQLLREGRFVDLYTVVREAIRVSEPRYSIKNLEIFYMEKRAGDVTSAGASIVYYEKWRQTGDDSLLRKIRDYNEDDCRSTCLLHQWLLSLKPQAAERVISEAEPERADKSDEVQAHEDRLALFEARLLADQPESRDQWTAEHCLRERLFHLLDFHRRAAKPAWWALFARRDMSVEELIEDAECIAGLSLIEGKAAVSLIRPNGLLYQYPEQDFKLRAGDRVLNTSTTKTFGTITAINEDLRIIELWPSKKTENPKQLSVSSGGPINADELKEALFRLAEGLLDGGGSFKAAFDFLRKTPPRISGHMPGTPLVDAASTSIDEIVRAVAAMDQSALFIQGPPGAGKTFTGSHLIVALMKLGYRVGVSSNSHKAIHNLRRAVETQANEQAFEFRGAYKASQTKGSEFDGTCIHCYATNNEIVWHLDQPSCQLYAGTAWLFADPQFEQELDYLFVDEAGQVATANLFAMATSAKNLVLLGDQMQLGQPIQGTHPGDSGLSALDYLLDGQATIAPDRGIFLATTWRMHPDVCRFISDAVYEGRLQPEPKNANQRLILAPDAHPDLRPTGLRYIPAKHDGCSQKSEEEADIVAVLYNSLLRQRYRNRDGNEHAMTLDNILVVAPYNMQVNLLKRRLPEGARVGTVDKFQGQEAEAVIVSMTTSNGDTLPRFLEFLYSKNRLNVAISRARCLALLVASPDLEDISCVTVRQIGLVNMFCNVSGRN